MPLQPLDQKHLDVYLGRLQQLSPDTPRLWGTMTTTQMLNHVRSLVLISLEQKTERDVSTWLMRLPATRYLLLALPWPKGKIKAPIVLQVGEPSSFKEERSLLMDALREFAAATAATPHRRTRSPLLGLLALEFWSRLHGKHLDHHLRQFGA